MSEEQRIKYKRWTEAEILDATGKPYDAMLTTDAEISMQDVMRFYDEHMTQKTARDHVKKVVREMATSESKLRVYIHSRDCPTFDRPLNLNMNLIALREVFKAFERDTQDKGHGWYSSTPLNIITFYQIFELTGVKAWHEERAGRNVSQPTTNT